MVITSFLVGSKRGLSEDCSKSVESMCFCANCTELDAVLLVAAVFWRQFVRQFDTLVFILPS